MIMSEGKYGEKLRKTHQKTTAINRIRYNGIIIGF